MKRNLLIIALMLCSTFSFAQKAHEIGLTFYNFDSYGLAFKTGKKTALTRFSIFNVSHRNSETTLDNGDKTKSKNWGFGVSLGREYRIALSEKFNFVVGPQVGYSDYKAEDENAQRVLTNKQSQWSVGIIVGGNYEISEKFVVSVEIVPNAYFGKSSTTYDDLYNIEQIDETSFTGFNISNGTALITIAFRILPVKTE